MLLLLAASSLVVTMAGERRDVDVTLQRWEENGRRVDVAQRHAGRGAPPIAFENLDSGTYAIVVRGGGPLAVQATKVNVGRDERRRAAIAVHPVRVDGTASFAGKPLANATLAFTNEAMHWRGELRTGIDGRFAAELWQPGRVVVTASGGALAAPFTDTAELRGGRFDFVIPDRQLRGRVLDAASGRGVPNALVTLRSSHGDLRSTAQAATDGEGTFLFNAVAPGAQHVTVLANGYLMPDAIELTTKESDPPRALEVVLDTGAPRALRVFLHDGRPAAGAELDAVANGEIRAISITDAAGRATVPLPREGEPMIYVVPREGGFAAIAPRDAERVDLPAPSSSLRIVARSTDGAPMPDFALLMSFNGRVIPAAVARRIGAIQGLSLSTNGDSEVVLRNIPAGWYQFWPYRGDAEAQNILAAGALEAPIAVNVKTGENAVAVDFQKRR